MEDKDVWQEKAMEQARKELSQEFFRELVEAEKAKLRAKRVSFFARFLMAFLYAWKHI
jgi:hypothetical protein